MLHSFQSSFEQPTLMLPSPAAAVLDQAGGRPARILCTFGCRLNKFAADAELWSAACYFEILYIDSVVTLLRPATTRMKSCRLLPAKQPSTMLVWLLLGVLLRFLTDKELQCIVRSEPDWRSMLQYHVHVRSSQS